MTRPLITARDVSENAELHIPAGAIVTPLARDLLRQRGLDPRGLPFDGRALDGQALSGQAPAREGCPEVQRFVVANWKCHKTTGEALDFAAKFRERRAKKLAARAVVCPPFTSLALLHHALGDAAEVGAQDLSADGEGAHTGEIAARHLVDVGCGYVLVGHSERRHAGESDALVRRKLRRALGAKLRPILCVGETASERKAGRASVVVSDQTRAALGGLSPAEVAQTILAYEPRWAIGTGATPTLGEVEDMLSHARQVLISISEASGAGVSILYGGSVKPKNAGALLALPSCAGALVGGAALDPEGFASILDQA